MDVLTMQDLWQKNVDGYLPILIEIYNPDIKWSEEEISAYGQSNGYLRLISDQNRVVYRNKTWLPCNFSYTLPESDGSKIGNSSITISALDARVRRLLKSIRITSDISIIAVFSKASKDNGKYVYRFAELNSLTMKMDSASKSNTSASFNLIFDNALSQNIPYDKATQDRTPAVND